MKLYNINSYDPSDWEYLGHRVVYDGGVFGYPGLGFEHSVTCSCGAFIRSLRESAPEFATNRLRDDFIQHAIESENTKDDEYQDDSDDEEDPDYFYDSRDDAFPEDEYERATVSPEYYLEHLDELTRDGWVQVYTINDELTVLARKRG